MNTDIEIRQILKMKTIAVVGMSPKPERYSHKIGKYLKEQGYTVIPVNPGHDEIIGLRTYPTLKDIPFPVDVVNVFRKAEFCEPIAKISVEIGAKALWLQEGIVNNNAMQISTKGGLFYVQNRCILKEHILYSE
ncbi:MAG: CoA-binding protein [Candidatus Marinimicrobia bacterium]|nr:CoA-binding protein [Candidatus Neomarinimicrobiota bacterium]MBL7109385.1 CoA-binding protein [Candidatus Neomarinimicrobiota bacterium]